jgi:hypothetical protein
LAAPRWIATIARLMRNLGNSQKLLVDRVRIRQKSADPKAEFSRIRLRSARAQLRNCRFGLVVLLFAFTGCGSGTPALTPVYGKVAVNGVPLHIGTIIFTPDPLRGTLGPLAHAEIQTDGSYTLATGDQPGAAEGWYRVTIVALEPASSGQAGQRLLPHSLLPEKYRDPELSGLVCEIKAGQDNRIDFNLE